MDNEKEISFGAFDSELMHQEIFIPEGFTATIDGDKIILTRKDSGDERIRRELIGYIVKEVGLYPGEDRKEHKWLRWLEKQGEHKKFRDSIQVGDEVTRNSDGVIVNLSQLKRVAKKDEKQGEQKPIDKIQLGKKYKCIASPRYSTFRRGNIYKPVDNFLCNLMNLCYECFEPIEDSEQKPADKVEPKFKVGNWVVHDMSDGRKVIRQIVNITNKSYVLDGEDFNTFYFNDLENNYHLWTIQDAKDGDVLINWNNTAFIFKTIEDETVKFHVAYNEKWGTIKTPLTKLHHLGLSRPLFEFRPATKEQRDLLFQKMYEAGYEWDAEKKELRKIEPTETAKWSAQEEYCICELEAMVRETWGKAEKVRNDITIKKMQELMFFLKTLNPSKKP